MDPSMLMLLPKGIVTNTHNIYDEVASYPVVPPDKVYEYWHVYTTTNKKLQDPTARRLENFWWHVWGSDRRALSGRALARIFEDISVGQTFVPLRGPADSWEGSDSPLAVDMLLAQLRAGPVAHSPQNSIPSALAKGGDGDASPTVSSASSRPAQPHPILKKTRGLSSSKPRPTARIISPHESADEGDLESEIPSSGSTVATGLDDSIIHASSRNATTLSAPQTSHPSASKPNCPAAASPSTPPVLNGIHTREDSMSGTIHNLEQTSRDSQRTIQQKPPIRHPQTRDGHAGHLSTSSKHTESTTALPKRQSDTSIDSSAQPAGSLHSQAGHQRLSDLSAATRPKRALFTGATASTTNVAVRGTIIDQSGAPDETVPGSLSSLRPSIHGISSPSTLLEPRLAPTQPSSSASLPLARTKSQLTLLLEREKERARDGPHFKN